MIEENRILYKSEEAAVYESRTLTGWWAVKSTQTRGPRFWGEEEHMARYTITPESKTILYMAILGFAPVAMVCHAVTVRGRLTADKDLQIPDQPEADSMFYPFWSNARLHNRD